MVFFCQSSLPLITSVSSNQMWHQTYRNFRETTIFMVTGLELFQKTKYGDTSLKLFLIPKIGNMNLNLQISYQGFKSYEYSGECYIYF